MFHVLHEHLRQKLGSTGRSHTISIGTKQDIATFAGPRITLRIGMYQITIRSVRAAGITCISHTAHHGSLYHVAHLRRAVIVKIVVPVFAIFRKTIHHQIRPQTISLFARQIECLLRNARTTFLVFFNKNIPRNPQHHIITLTQDEAPQKMRLAKGEHSVIKCHIGLTREVATAQCSVPIERIDLIAWRARDKRGFY